LRRNKKAPTPKDVREIVLKIRAKKGMVIMENHESYKSAGSFFKNPIVSQNIFKKIKELVYKENYEKAQMLEPWHWDEQNGNVKISAGFLMEFTPYNKTAFRGDKVTISPKHTLSIINLGNASSKNVIELVKKIRNSVKDKFDILLEPEIVFVGLESDPLA